MNSRRWITLGAAVVYFLLDAGEAFAWGPVTHVRIAGDVLSNLQYLPAAVGAILARYGSAYLYGTLAADVVFAKRMSRVKQFCHHWSTGFKLLHEAANDREKSFAYGYLSHLAADTVAHGKFVPHQIVLCQTSVNFGHLYWELRADAAAGEAARLELERLLAEAHDPHHETLSRVLTDTLLPYAMNKAFFDRVNRLAARTGYHRSLSLWGKCSRWGLPPTLIEGYRTECVDRTLCLLSEGAKSPLLREDPNGSAALAFAAASRRHWRRLDRLGVPLLQRPQEAAAGHAPARWPFERRALAAGAEGSSDSETATTAAGGNGVG